MLRPGYFFAKTTTGSGDGSTPLIQKENESTTVVVRSKGVFCPSFSVICVWISGTAIVNVISNPFENDIAKDRILTTFNTAGSNRLILPSSDFIFLDVTAVTGTVSARVIYEQEIEG